MTVLTAPAAAATSPGIVFSGQLTANLTISDSQGTWRFSQSSCSYATNNDSTAPCRISITNGAFSGICGSETFTGYATITDAQTSAPVASGTIKFWVVTIAGQNFQGPGPAYGGWASMEPTAPGAPGSDICVTALQLTAVVSAA